MDWSISLLFVGLVLIIVLLPFQFQQTFGIDYFEKTDYRLSHNPNICYLAPLADPLIPNLDSVLYNQTQDAVADWQTKLNQGEKTPVWKMNLVYAQNQEYLDDKLGSSCDIVVSFVPQPENESIVNFEPEGITDTSPELHNAFITIYYLQLDFERNVLATNNDIHTYSNYTWATFYLNKLATDAQLGMAIRHQLGHAFGLGNYIISDQGKGNESTGMGNQSSIMVKETIPIDYSHFEITPIDIEELKSLYGNSGFTSLDQSTFYKDRVKSELALGTVSSKTFGDTMTYLKNNGELSFADNHKFLGHTIMPLWFKKNITWWLEGSITEKEFATGIQYLMDAEILKF